MDVVEGSSLLQITYSGVPAGGGVDIGFSDDTTFVFPPAAMLESATGWTRWSAVPTQVSLQAAEAAPAPVEAVAWVGVDAPGDQPLVLNAILGGSTDYSVQLIWAGGTAVQVPSPGANGITLPPA